MGREKRGGEGRRKDRRRGRRKGRIRRENTSVFPGNTYFIGEVLPISRIENKLSFWLSNYLSHSGFIYFFIFPRPGIPKLPTWVGTLELKPLLPQPVEWLAMQTPATPVRLILQLFSLSSHPQATALVPAVFFSNLSQSTALLQHLLPELPSSMNPDCYTNKNSNRPDLTAGS